MNKGFFLIFCLLTLSITIPSYAQNDNDNKWDVTTPDQPNKEITITTDEGTWMNLDVSPDGKQIVFDLLGDIFIMPVTGGNATLLRSGHAFESQPRFSPDGNQISFTSDAGGADNIWIMNTDGSDARQVTKEDFRLLNNAVWTPDGEYLVARKHFTSTRSLGAGEIWMYHKTGGTGIQLVEKKNAQQDIGEPWVSPDGRYIYYSEDNYPGGFFQYNKDPNSEIYVIRRYDRQEGDIETVVRGAGGAARPQVSPDGNYLAFVRRVRTESVLFLYELSTGRQWPVFDQLSKDQQEAWAIFGVYSNFNWTPDSKSIIVWANGKINKINIETFESEIIPFEASSEHTIVDALRFKQVVAPESFNAKAIRHAITSPGGDILVFNAAGYLWKKDLPDGQPVRLTDGSDFEFEPSFSTDGQKLVYSTWNDEKLGAIYTFDLTKRNARPVKVTNRKGIYREPAYSPDGKWIVYRKESGNNHQGFDHAVNPGIYVTPASGGEPSLISESGMFPRFSVDGRRIFYQTGGYLFGSLTKEYHSVNLNGNDHRKHFDSEYGQKFVLSPDNKWIAFSNLYKVYIAPLPQTGKSLSLTPKTNSIPVRQVAKDAGVSIHWSGDSQKLHWTLGDEYFTVDLRNQFTFVEGALDSLVPMPEAGIKIGLELKTDKPEGISAFTNARIITMNGDEVIENGTIIVEGNRITTIGPSNEIDVPNNAFVLDLSGKTVMPGIVDAHAHLGNFRYGQSPQQQWEYFANLAYGVTTAHDPSANSEMIFSQSEMIKAGHMVGPRVYSTGIILYGADGDFKAVINNLDDARSAVRRTKAWGAFTVKSYNQPRREQRQQVIKAAREMEMMVVPEGGSFFFHNMSMILDGHTGIEHNVPVAPLFNDVQQLWSASSTGYTPTFVVNYGSISGEYYWYQKTNVWENEKLLTFTPRSLIDARSRHRTMIPDEEYENGHILTSESAKLLTDNGVKVNVGAHGQLQGLGAHWELWMMHQGGMNEMQALRTATINGASYIGLDEDIGSLETGKLADFIVLDKNPLDNIRNTQTVRYTIANGRIFDTSTMNEIGNRKRKRMKFFWERNEYHQQFDWHAVSGSFERPQIHCSCGYSH